jgi:hypothetical protein
VRNYRGIQNNQQSQILLAACMIAFSGRAEFLDKRASLGSPNLCVAFFGRFGDTAAWAFKGDDIKLNRHARACRGHPRLR